MSNKGSPKSIYTNNSFKSFLSAVSTTPDSIQSFGDGDDLSEDLSYTSYESQEESEDSISKRQQRDSLKGKLDNLTPMHAHSIRQLSDKDRSVLQWSGWLDYRLFLCSAIIGLGNMVYFPLYFITFGGFHFLAAYIILIVCVGYPMALMEAGLGQFCSFGPGRCWEFGKLFQGLGYVMIIYAVIDSVLTFNRMLPLLILQYDITHTYPWKQNLESHTSNSTEERFKMNQANYSPLPDLPEFNPNNDPTLLKTAIIYAVNWVLIGLLLVPNIRTRGYVISRLFLLFGLFVLVITVRAMALPGAIEGIGFTLSHGSDKTLQNFDVWLAAFRRCFFSLNLTPGTHMTIASYNHFNNQICEDVLFCVLLDTFFCVFGMVMTFSFLGNFAETTTFKLKDIFEKKLSVHSLVLAQMPYTLSKEKYGFAWVFFFLATWTLLMQLHVSVLMEVLITAIIDIFKIEKNKRKSVVLIVCGLFSICFTWMCTPYSKNVIKVLSSYTQKFFPFPTVISLCFMGSVFYSLGVDRFLAMLECCVGWYATPVLSNRWWKLWWKTCWMFTVPLVYLAVIIAFLYQAASKTTAPMDTWMLVVGHCIWGLFFIAIFGTMVYLIATEHKGSFLSRLKYLTRPSKRWGPSFPQNRYIMKVGEEDKLKEQLNEKNKGPAITNYSQLSY